MYDMRTGLRRVAADPATRRTPRAPAGEPLARRQCAHPDGCPGATRLAYRSSAGAAASLGPLDRRAPVDLPCRVHGPDLWFAEAPRELERAKVLCGYCPAKSGCLAGAIERREPAGVWGGQIFHHGQILAYKRPRGRPRKNSAVLPGELGLPVSPT